MEIYGPPCPFRQCGKTWEAGQYHYSRLGLSIIAEHNGVTVEQFTKGMRYAPNEYMRRWITFLGALKANGIEYSHPDGSFVSPREARKRNMDSIFHRFRNTFKALS